MGVELSGGLVAGDGLQRIARAGQAVGQIIALRREAEKIGAVGVVLLIAGAVAYSMKK